MKFSKKREPIEKATGAKLFFQLFGVRDEFSGGEYQGQSPCRRNREIHIVMADGWVPYRFLYNDDLSLLHKVATNQEIKFLRVSLLLTNPIRG